jgi:hypothetical protein
LAERFREQAQSSICDGHGTREERRRERALQLCGLLPNEKTKLEERERKKRFVVGREVVDIVVLPSPRPGCHSKSNSKKEDIA